MSGGDTHKKEIVYWPTVYNYNVNNDNIEKSLWNKCILNRIGVKLDGNGNIGHTGDLELDVESGRLIVKSEGNISIAHAPSCPFRDLEKSKSIIHQDLQIDLNAFPKFKVGVSVLIEDADQRVFITRRSDKLRIFPGIWVLPGGHMEVNETFIETGIREVKEETGIDINPELDKLSVIGIFESTYPNNLQTDRLPVDHHIVVFLYIKLSNRLHSNSIKLQASEVSLSTWFPKQSLHLILENQLPNEFNSKSNSIPSNNVNRDEDIEVIYPEDYNDTRLTPKELKDLFLKSKELISTATIYILKQYINI